MQKCKNILAPNALHCSFSDLSHHFRVPDPLQSIAFILLCSIKVNLRYFTPFLPQFPSTHQVVLCSDKQLSTDMPDLT